MGTLVDIFTLRLLAGSPGGSSGYGGQRLWTAVAWGIGSLAAGSYAHTHARTQTRTHTHHTHTQTHTHSLARTTWPSFRPTCTDQCSAGGGGKLT